MSGIAPFIKFYFNKHAHARLSWGLLRTFYNKYLLIFFFEKGSMALGIERAPKAVPKRH